MLAKVDLLASSLFFLIDVCGNKACRSEKNRVFMNNVMEKKLIFARVKRKKKR